MKDEKSLLARLDDYSTEISSATTIHIRKDVGGYTVDNNIGKTAKAQSLTQAIEEFLDKTKTPPR